MRSVSRTYVLTRRVPPADLSWWERVVERLGWERRRKLLVGKDGDRYWERYWDR